MRLRVATYNIHRCVGMDGIADCRRIAAVLAEIGADVVALQEVSSFPDDPDDLLAYLEQATGMAAIEGFTLMARTGSYGNALLSKIQVSAVNRINISVAGREPRGVIEGVLGRDARKIYLWATHIGLGVRERHFQISELLKVIDSANAHQAILLGDLNEWLPWGRPIRALHRRFAQAWTPATFPSIRPLFKLDRILVRPLEKETTFKTHASQLSRIASDHLPLVADIVFPHG